MKKYFRAMLMCFGMFCAVPCPYRKWDEDARPLTTLFLPLVGAFIGALWTLTAYLLQLLRIPPILSGALLCAYPFVITGGIHMDGFMDVTDAIKSYRGLEERRRILKDPHVGSFAIFSAILLICVQFAAFACVKASADIFALLPIPIVSRCMAALFVTVLRPMSVSEYAGAYRKGVRGSHVIILLIILAAAVACGFVFLGNYGFVSLAVIAGCAAAALRAFKSLDGMNGDIAGFALTIGELCGILLYSLI